MRKRAILAGLALLVATAACSWAGTYKDELIAKYPFYKTTIGSFAPVYPALAKQIVQDYGITKGICVDMGGGCGSLDMALARITHLTCYDLDINPWAVRLCNLLASEKGLTKRVMGVQGDAQNMPFRSNFADLVVSRGSIFFWPNQLAGVKEAYRVLKPGGVAYIGGGFSRLLAPKIRDKLVARREKQLRAGHGGSGWKPLDKNLVAEARAAGIEHVREIREKGMGWWIEIRKPRAASGPAAASQATAAPRTGGTYEDELIAHYPFYRTTIGRFAPVYPALARQLVQDYGITKGICVDMGGGCGSLDMALARITHLTCYDLDINPWAVRLCNFLATKRGLADRVIGVLGDAQRMPFRDDFADLVVSRGSMPFWPNQLAGIKEAYRILKPGGVAFVGGGFSRLLPPKTLATLVAGQQQRLGKGRGIEGFKPMSSDLVAEAKAAGIGHIREIKDAGVWFEIRK